MSFNKCLSMMIIIICILLLSNGIYAADTENTDIEQDTIKNNEYVEQTNVNNYTDLKKIFNKVKTSNKKNHEINIKEGTYKFTQPLNGIFESESEKEITINGNNAIMDGRKQRDFLTISKNIKVSINNLTIINMNGIIGPTIVNSGTLILNNVTFENNTGENDDPSIGGGAIYTDSSMNITNCTFKNNGGNIAGSAIFILEQDDFTKEININNCEFSSNNALSTSTIHILGETITNIKDTTFNNENSVNSIIHNEKSYLTIDNCTFNNENASNIILNNKECLINNSLFQNNTIENIIVNSRKINIINSEISNNIVNTIVTNTKNLTINNSQINNNTINQSLLLNNIPSDNENYVVNITKTCFANNTSNNTCGLENKNKNTTTFIDSSMFVNNTSLLNKGIISDYFGEMHITNTGFYNNTAEDLFVGNLINYNLVQDNTYHGNLLKTYLNASATSFNDKVNVKGTLKSDDIYNTTVNSGTITIKQNDNIVYEGSVLENTFIVEPAYTGNDLNSLTLFYNGMNDFRDISENLEVFLLKEEYEIEIKNINGTLIYGDYVSFDLNIRNTGNVSVNNILLTDVLPSELTYFNSTDVFNNESNEYRLDSLDVNENKSITFYVIPDKYEDLSLDFNIIDNKQNTNYHTTEEIVYIKPKITFNSCIAHPGEIINITANINNYNKNTIDNVRFIFHYKEVESFSYTFNENVLTIENYTLSETLTKKNYLIELICDDVNLEEPFSNTSKIPVSKYETHSIIDYNVMGNYLNLTVNLFDEDENNVNAGSVIIKINGKTIKTLKVNAGVVKLDNYKLTGNYQNEYNISLIYTGNNKYNIHNNNISIKENKESVDFSIEYEIINQTIRLHIKITSNNGVLPESGYVAVKINEKSILPKMLIQEEYDLIYDINSIPHINNITSVYYGNENYMSKSKTINV